MIVLLCQLSLCVLVFEHSCMIHSYSLELDIKALAFW